MVGRLLLRGMLVGVLAALLSFAFLKVYGEPAVDRAIAFETQLDQAKEAVKQAAKETAGAGAALVGGVPAAEPELVSRPTQAGLGLLTGVGVYSVAFGGLFALAFAFAFGRMCDAGPRATAALLAVTGCVAIYLVPTLKYPANPPAIGDPDTIGIRTALYFSMIAASLVAMIAAGKLRRLLLERVGPWNAALLAAAFYGAAVVVAALAFPAIDEVPAQFPATVLWQFRVASLGAQLIMWATIGLLFGVLAERLLAGSPSRRAPAVAAGATRPRG